MRNKKDNILVVIPARGGSKGIPYKNIKHLAEKPLIYYTIDVAREITSDNNICISSDDEKIIETVNNYGLQVPFKRPSQLANDAASTNGVLLHAINFYEGVGREFDTLLLLQPTSPFRRASQIKEALEFFTNNVDVDMVVSVKNSHSASVLCTENNNGFLEFCFNTTHKTRQNFDNFYEVNGAIYIINIKRLKEYGLSGLKSRIKYLMDDITSLDIDTPLDWIIAENIIKEGYI